MITPLSVGPSPDSSAGPLPHVLLVIDQLPKTLGGGERIALRLAEFLPQYGYRASILTFSAHPEGPALKSAPCPIYLLPLQRTYDLQAFRAAFALKRFLGEREVRIVQTFFESSDIWAGLVTKSLSNAKLVWSRRDMGILRTGKHHLAYRLMSGMPDAVFAVSEQVRRHCIQVDGIAPSLVQTVYNGLDLASWAPATPRTRDRREIRIRTVGNIRRVKGHDVLIRAAADVVQRHPDVTFSIAGNVMEPEYFQQLEALVSDLGLTDRFHFAGEISNLREYLATADIFALPSRSEGFSNAIIEAMAASLPVVATNVGGNAEAVENGINGFIVPADDPAQLAEALNRLLDDKSLAGSMGAAGRRMAEERFTTEAMMNRIASAYRILLTGHGFP